MEGKMILYSIPTIVWVLLIGKSSYQLVIESADFYNVDIEDAEWELYKRTGISIVLHYLLLSGCRLLGHDKKIHLVFLMWLVYGHVFTAAMMTIVTLYGVVYHLRSKIILFIISFCCIVINHKSHKIMPISEDITHVLHASVSWAVLWCFSFCLDCWKNEEGKPFMIDDYLDYIFYPPVLIFGPFLSYKTFIRTKSRRNNNIIADTLKIGMVAACIEILSFILPFRTMSIYIDVHDRVSTWCICGCLFWNGLYYFLKYLVLYGVASILMKVDGIKTHPLPCCVGHIYRYTTLWRHFDVAIMLFMKRYIYEPIQQEIQESKASQIFVNTLPRISCFIFVAVWHGLSYETTVWTLINWAVSILEKTDTSLQHMLLNEHVKMVYNEVVRPILFVPITAISILNNSIRCSNFSRTISFMRSLWKNGKWWQIAASLYFGVQVGIGVEKMALKKFNNV